MGKSVQNQADTRQIANKNTVSYAVDGTLEWTVEEDE